MDIHKLITRYKQFGGAKLVWQYVKLGALGPAIKAGVRCLVKRQSFKAIYPEVLKRVEPFLVQKYGSKVQEIFGGGLVPVPIHEAGEYPSEHIELVYICP